MSLIKLSLKLIVSILSFSQLANAQAVLIITPDPNSSAQCPLASTGILTNVSQVVDIQL